MHALFDELGLDPVGNAPAEFAAIIKNEALEPISFVSAKSLSEKSLSEEPVAHD
jgi:hypothetical protein